MERRARDYSQVTVTGRVAGFVIPRLDAILIGADDEVIAAAVLRDGGGARRGAR